VDIAFRALSESQTRVSGTQFAREGLLVGIRSPLHRKNPMFNAVDEDDFNEQVLCANGMVLVNFWAWWSEECRNMASLMHNVAEFLDAQDVIVQVDWDKQKRLAHKLEVFGVPTLVIYINGRELVRYSGTMNRDDFMKRIVEAKSCDAC
jgi:thioredoxin 1